MERLTLVVLRFRWAVLAVWLVLLVAAGAAASGLTDLLTNRFTLPGTDTAKVEHVLQQSFGQIPDGSFTVVARNVERAELEAVFQHEFEVLSIAFSPGGRWIAAVGSGAVVRIWPTPSRVVPSNPEELLGWMATMSTARLQPIAGAP